MNQPTAKTARRKGVYRRTHKGHEAAVSGARFGLTQQQQRLLLLVNGFTPINYLVDMAQYGGEFDGEYQTIIDSLRDSGLIVEESQPAHH
jgi:hypothetical protein